ncbi:MAG: hypothetical protein ACKVOB_10655 [Sphingomonas sp.]
MAGKLRYLLLPMIAILAVGAVQSAMTSVWRERRPAWTLAVDPRDGIAAIRQADLVLAGAVDPGTTLSNLAPTARAAIANTPLNPSALGLLGAAEFVANHPEAGSRLLNLSQRLSRRDLRTQIVLIEQAVGRGDVNGALRHYDLALSTNNAAGDLLFPVLGRAIAAPQVRDSLATYVRRDPSWLRRFLVHYIASPENPVALSQLIRRAGGLPAHPDYRHYETQVLWALTQRGAFDEARALFLMLPGATPAMLRSVSISPDNAQFRFGPMAWLLIDRPEVGAALEAPDRLSVRMGSGQGGLAAQKYLYLLPGDYRFSFKAMFGEEGGRATIQLWCSSPGPAKRLFNRELLPHQPVAVSDTWSVPKGCTTQLLMITATGDDTQAESNLQLSNIAAEKL